MAATMLWIWGPTTGQLIADITSTAQKRPSSRCWLSMFLSPEKDLKAFALDQLEQRSVFDAAPFHAGNRLNFVPGQKPRQLARHVLVEKYLKAGPEVDARRDRRGSP